MTTDLNIGIEAMSFYSSHYYVDLATLAERRGVDPQRYTHSTDQERMAVPPPGEDTVTLAANAAAQALDGIDKSTITGLFFASESAVDQSKAGAIYVHSLLGLSPRCRCMEFKQACYAGTGALRMAQAYVQLHPNEKVLVTAGDIARYGLKSAGEATQGCGAVAILVSANPKLLILDDESGFCTEDVMDFWRPNYRDEALVDGKASVMIYIRTLIESWRQYCALTGRGIDDFEQICYHLPFSRMAITAHQRLLKSVGIRPSVDELKEQIGPSLVYNRTIGNSYTASLYIGLCSLLENSDRDFSGKRIGMFGYGSGCMAEFFSGVVAEGYRDHLKRELHHEMLTTREEVSPGTYSEYYNFGLPTDGSALEVPAHPTGRFRLAAIRDHKRIYESVSC